MQGTGKCRSCPAQLRFVRTAAGKKMPCDPQPVTITPGLVTADKKVTILNRDGVLVSGAVSEGPVTGLEVTGYQPHWATCPGRDRHRRPKPPKPEAPQLGLFGDES